MSDTPAPQSSPSPTPSPAPADSGGSPTTDEKTMAMLAHLLGIVTSFLGALLIWLIKKDQSEFVNDQGKEALNFQITFVLAYAACVALTFVVIGCFLMPVIVICNIIFCIMGALAANKGQRYRYPVAIRLIK